MKSANEAQAEAPESNSKWMSALSLFMNGKRKRESDPIAFMIHFATGQ
jgi:predicted transcriptional regulator